MLNHNKSTLSTVKKPDPLSELDWAFLFTDPYLLRILLSDIEHLFKHRNRTLHVKDSFEVFFSYKGYNPMPRKKADQNGQKPNDENRSQALLGWVNVTILDEHTPEIERLSSDLVKVATGLLELVAQGFDVSCKWTDGGKSCMACIIGRVSDGKDGRAGVSAFASNPADATAALLFKYYVLLDGQLPSPGESRERKYR